jgi:hypothetical protein
VDEPHRKWLACGEPSFDSPVVLQRIEMPYQT